jgi:hypothetical protein
MVRVAEEQHGIVCAAVPMRGGVLAAGHHARSSLTVRGHHYQPRVERLAMQGRKSRMMALTAHSAVGRALAAAHLAHVLGASGSTPCSA